MEDIQNPEFAMAEISNRSTSRHPLPSWKCPRMCRHQLAVTYEEDVVNFLTKYPIVDQMHLTNEDKINCLLNNFPIYWNTYIFVEEGDNVSWKMLKNEADFHLIQTESFNKISYPERIADAIAQSFADTNKFVKKYLSNTSVSWL